MDGGISSLSMVFPAYNEENNVPLLLEKIADFRRMSGLEDVEAIIVNDGSRDRTGELLEEYREHFPWLKVIHHRTNRGYGAAVKSGLLAADKEAIFFTDADLQFDFCFLPCFLFCLREYPAVIGYRAPRVDPWYRCLFGFLWTGLARMFFGLRVRDVDCAFKVFRSEVKEIVKEVRSEGATFSLELLVLLREAGWKWRELPVPHFPRKLGKQSGARPGVVFRSFREFFSFWRDYCRRKNLSG